MKNVKDVAVLVQARMSSERCPGKMARPFFKKCGKNLGIGRNVTFYNPSKIEIGKSEPKRIENLILKLHQLKFQK